jgi:ribose transport system permease protein
VGSCWWGTFIALYALAWGIKGLQLNYPTSGNWISPLFYGVSLLAAVSLASHQGVVRVKRKKGDDEVETTTAIPAAQSRS